MEIFHAGHHPAVRMVDGAHVVEDVVPVSVDHDEGLAPAHRFVERPDLRGGNCLVEASRDHERRHGRGRERCRNARKGDPAADRRVSPCHENGSAASCGVTEGCDFGRVDVTEQDGAARRVEAFYEVKRRQLFCDVRRRFYLGGVTQDDSRQVTMELVSRDNDDSPGREVRSEEARLIGVSRVSVAEQDDRERARSGGYPRVRCPRSRRRETTPG